jgi:DegV family protein with EDD domain
MKPVTVVTDSTAGLPADLVARHGLHIIPLWVHSEEQSYRDGVDLMPNQFYPLLAQAPDLPTTSQPSAGEFLELYRELAREAEAIVSVHISTELSGTVASALAARQMFHDVPVHVVDSRSTSMGLGLNALAAARAAAEGQNGEQVAAVAERLVPWTSVLFVVDTLEYLRKGGRIGGASALAGSLIRIKPILHIHEGRIDALDKVRTRRKALDRLMGIVAERVGGAGPIHVAVVHAAAPAEAEALWDRLAHTFDLAELHLAEISPAIGTHVGPGTVGVAFYPAAQESGV